MNTKQFLAIGAFVATVAAAPLSARANDITGSTACIIRGDPSKLTDEQIHQMCSGIGPKNEVMEAFVAAAPLSARANAVTDATGCQILGNPTHEQIVQMCRAPFPMKGEIETCIINEEFGALSGKQIYYKCGGANNGWSMEASKAASEQIGAFVAARAATPLSVRANAVTDTTACILPDTMHPPLSEEEDLAMCGGYGVPKARAIEASEAVNK